MNFISKKILLSAYDAHMKEYNRIVDYYLDHDSNNLSNWLERSEAELKCAYKIQVLIERKKIITPNKLYRKIMRFNILLLFFLLLITLSWTNSFH